MVFNLSDRDDLGVKEMSLELTDGYQIRRATVDTNIPLFTKVSTANLFINSLYKLKPEDLKVKSWCEYLATIQPKDKTEKL